MTSSVYASVLRHARTRSAACGKKGEPWATCSQKKAALRSIEEEEEREQSRLSPFFVVVKFPFPT
jgi:hypothetical protein